MLSTVTILYYPVSKNQNFANHVIPSKQDGEITDKFIHLQLPG